MLKNIILVFKLPT